MKNVKGIRAGDKVRFVDEAAHIEYPCYYPPVGTIGEVRSEGFSRENLWVKWPKGSTSEDDMWVCRVDSVELVTEGG